MTFKSNAKWIVLIAVIVCAVYANSIGGEFVYDDNRQIGRNPLIQDISLAGKALASDVWAFKGDGKMTASNYWRPTFTAWHILNFRVFGLNPAGWHVTSILLHLGVCVLAFFLLRRWDLSALTAFAVVLLFAVHPVHVESVAWISGSTDLLFAICLLASLWFAENRRLGGGGANLAAALAFYAVALGAKEVALVCLPLYFLVFSRDDRAEAGDAHVFRSKTALISTLPFAFVATVYFFSRLAVLGKLTHEVENATPLGAALLSAPGVFLFYLTRIVFPSPVSINFATRPTYGFDLPGFVVPALFSIAIIVFVVFLVRRSYIRMAGAALFLLPLVPAFNLTAFPVDQIVHDRYLYLPLLGALLIVFAALESRIAPRLLLIVAVTAAIPLSILTILGNRVWSSDLALWEHAVRVDPASASNFSQYGTALSLAGRHQEAIEAYNSALRIAPLPNAYLGRAQSLVAIESFEEAVRDLQAVTGMQDADVNAYMLYQSYEALAVALQRKNDLERAERILREARKRLPIYSAALTEKIAVIMYLRNNKAEALAELEAVQTEARAELLPNSKAVFFRMGLLYAEKGDNARAKAALQEFLKLTSRYGNETLPAERKAAVEALRKLG